MQNPKKTVDFGITMKPSAAMRTIVQPHGPDQDEISRHATGGLMMLKILSMNHQERTAVVAEQMDDLLVVWFALLSKQERRELLKAAEKTIKEELGKET